MFDVNYYNKKNLRLICLILFWLLKKKLSIYNYYFNEFLEFFFSVINNEKKFKFKKSFNIIITTNLQFFHC